MLPIIILLSVFFRIRRFFSFHKLLDNSQAWIYILAWLLFYSLSPNLARLTFSNTSFGSWQVPLPSNVRALMLLTFGTGFLSSSAVSNKQLGFCVSHILLILLFSYLIANALVSVSKFSDSILHLSYRLWVYSKSTFTFVSIKDISKIFDFADICHLCISCRTTILYFQDRHQLTK